MGKPKRRNGRKKRGKPGEDKKHSLFSVLGLFLYCVSVLLWLIRSSSLLARAVCGGKKSFAEVSPLSAQGPFESEPYCHHQEDGLPEENRRRSAFRWAKPRRRPVKDGGERLGRNRGPARQTARSALNTTRGGKKDRSRLAHPATPEKTWENRCPVASVHNCNLAVYPVGPAGTGCRPGAEKVIVRVAGLQRRRTFIRTTTCCRAGTSQTLHGPSPGSSAVGPGGPPRMRPGPQHQPWSGPGPEFGSDRRSMESSRTRIPFIAPATARG